VIAEDQTAIRAQATRFGVAGAVHPDDHIFNWLMSRPFPSREAAIEYYFRDGAQSAAQARALAAQHLPLAGSRPAVLEFASGYGMVSRHLARDSSIDLWSCDIHAEAVRFLEDAIGVRALLSSPCPEALHLSRSFDLVFALSFFSHMPITTWARWLVRLVQATTLGGITVFTSHGMASHQVCGEPPIPETGFWFSPHSEQADLPGEQYGATLTTPAFVRAHIATLADVELVECREGYWWGHQDLWVLRRLGDDRAR
jgi:hypothetical protein